MTTMEDDQNRRRPKWKTTKMEDDQNGRRPKWKTTKMEDDQNGRRPTVNRAGVLCSELTSTKKEEDLTPIFTSIALKCDYIKAGLGIKMLWRKSLDENVSRQKWKMNKIEDDQNGRRPKWKTTKMEDDRNGRRPKWKTTKMEDHQNG